MIPITFLPWMINLNTKWGGSWSFLEDRGKAYCGIASNSSFVPCEHCKRRNNLCVLDNGSVLQLQVHDPWRFRFVFFSSASKDEKMQKSLSSGSAQIWAPYTLIEVPNNFFLHYFWQQVGRYPGKQFGFSISDIVACQEVSPTCFFYMWDWEGV